MEPTNGEYDIDSVAHIDDLRTAIAEVYNSDNPADRLADILLNGHVGSSGYLSFGNNKVAKNTGIFNMNSATDCPNADSSEENQSDVGVCQVPWEMCYAHKSENIFNNALPKRRRQEYLWDSMDADTFAAALLRVKERKRSAFDYLRVSESGDFRHNGDIMAWERIAELVDPHITVYTYSASHKLTAWDNVEYMTVNQSNDLADYGHRRFIAVPAENELPEDTVWCAFDYADQNGAEKDERPKCGECTLCIEKDAGDVAIPLH
jgi:hypothetical protein